MNGKVYMVVLMVFMFMVPIVSAEDLVLWHGNVCEAVPYQKSIESVSVSNGTIFVGCSYRQVSNASGMVGIYYLGMVSAYSLNGTRLWQNDSGYVIKLYPMDNGNLVVGSMGGFITFDSTGKFIFRNLTRNKLYDFWIGGNVVYTVDGDFFVDGNKTYYVGHLYQGRLTRNGVVLDGWVLNFSSLTSRVRVGDDVIYVGSGFPSGYKGPVQFGEVYGVSSDGNLLWKLDLGEWVRDMEIWGGNVIAGTGSGTYTGHLYYVSKNGEIIWNRTLFYVEDIEVGPNRVYVGGLGQDGGKIVAVNPSNGEIIWSKTFPWRVKVVRYSSGKLLVGAGKFETKEVNGSAIVYSVGALYILDPKTGDVLGEVPDTGYVRSIAVESNIAVVGTASQKFYVVDVGKVGEKKNNICGPGMVVLLMLVALVGNVKTSHRD